MTPRPTEQSVFAEALRLPSGGSRAAYLDAACAGEPALRARVEVLLRSSDEAGSFLEEPPTGLGGDLGGGGTAGLCGELPGDRIGRYRLLEQIGEGGCGVVYMAEQEEPVRRRVALKVIKPGMDTRSVIARFEAERQALALMDHPNIAKVFDGGATRTGRPYFVMELVRGVRITEFCEEAALPTEARLHLFVQVCQAVQHAHQKGIIHRDLKPSNILITINDGVPLPKVIDFGIAKATGQRLTDRTLFTHFHAFIGTPAYTSPEQAEMSSVDVDTRSDIYSLGVLLYELLTGRTPFDGEDLLRSGLDEMRRILREEVPVPPSTQLTRLAAGGAGRRRPRTRSVAALPGTDPVPVDRMPPAEASVDSIRGDLDWIVMKCLEKDRARRYETASALAADILCHLRHEPIQARPPGSLYLLRKLARRHRGTLSAVGVIIVVLLAAVVSLAVSNARIRRERNERDEALRGRSAALEAARESERHAKEQLHLSLQSQAQSRRMSRRTGQRLESLATIAEAARMRPAPELRDNAIAAMAMPDVDFGISWAAWAGDTKVFAYDSGRGRYARIGSDGAISVRTVEGDIELRRLATGWAVTKGRFAFSPDGRLLSWIGDEGKSGLWRWESGESVLPDFAGPQEAIAFSPDSRRVAVAQPGSIACFDTATGREIRRWPPRETVFAMAFHPDGRQLAVGHAGTAGVSIHDSESGALEAELPVGSGIRWIIEWHPDGLMLATGSSDPRIQIWDVNARSRVAMLEGHTQDVTFLSFDRRGDLLTSVSWDGSMRLWQPSPARMLMRLPISGWTAFSNEGPWPGLMTTTGDQVRMWRIVASDEYHTFLNPFGEGQSGFYDGAISPDGRLLAMACTDGVRLWDIAKGRGCGRLGLRGTMSAVFAPNGRELITCSPFDGLKRWPIETDPATEIGLLIGPPHDVPLPFSPKRIAAGGDGRFLAVAGEDAGECVMLDLATEKPVVKDMPHRAAGFLALSSDGRRLATGGWNSGGVRIRDGKTGRLLRELEVGMMVRVFMTPDDRELIVARSAEFIFFDLETFVETRRMPRELGMVPGYVAFSPDGALMALEMSPGVVHLKETRSGRTVARLEDPHGDLSTWMGFTPDGTQLITSGRPAGVIHRWDLRVIRTNLKAMQLDWDWPEFPPLEAGGRPPGPVRVRVVDGDVGGRP